MSDTPDYYSSIHRASIFNLLKPTATESILVLARVCTDETSLFNFVKPVVPSGETVHIIDTTTGLDTPVTIPQGYQATIVMTWLSMNQITKLKAYMDGELYAYIAPIAPGIWYENDIVTFQISDIDPTFSTSHTIDGTLTNLGAEDLEGEGIIDILVEEMGTPPMPTIKTVQCKQCGNVEDVDVKTSIWTCPKCMQVNWYYVRKVG